MAEQSSRVPIWVALIGLAGTLAAALIANWDKLFGRAEPPPRAATVATVTVPAAAPAPVTPAVPGVRLAGMWRDAANPSIVSTLTQEGNGIRFTRTGALPNGMSFESEGAGALDGTQLSTHYAARFANGQSSTGQCTGTVDPAATSITLRCTDTLLGGFQSTSVRR